MVAREVSIQRDVEEACLPAVVHRRHVRRDGVHGRAVLVEDAETAWLLRDEKPSARQERDRPGVVEAAGDWRDRNVRCLVIGRVRLSWKDGMIGLQLGRSLVDGLTLDREFLEGTPSHSDVTATRRRWRRLLREQ